MTPQQFIGLAVRLFAVWLVVSAVQAFSVGSAMSAQSGPEFSSLPYVVAGLYLLAALPLWFFPMSVAHKLLPRTSSQDTMRLPARDAITIGCAILGLWVIVMQALPSLSWYAVLAAFWLASGEPISSMEQSRHVELITGLVSLVVGLLLVTKAARIGAFILSRQQPPEQ